MGGKPRLFVVLELERFSVHKIDTSNCRAPKFFYVLNHQVRAAKVADKRPHARVVHCVGQVAHQHNVLPLVNHLPDGKGHEPLFRDFFKILNFVSDKLKKMQKDWGN